jgi:SPP1 gp7 family putative phage head morphogenesis protein
VIVELNGTSVKTARRCAHRFLERTAAAKTLEAPAPRSYALSKRAAKLERARMRLKVAGTKRLRDGLLGVLNDWRGEVVAAVRKIHVREADTAALDADLAKAVSSGVLTDEQRKAIMAAVTAALASMDPQKLANVISQVQQELFQAGLDSAKGEVGLTWDVPPTNALDALSAATIPFSQKIVAQEIAAIEQALYDGISAGEGVPQLADRIQDVFDDGMHVLSAQGEVTRVIPSDSWAEMVARTETSRAMNAGVFVTYRAAGVEQIMWVAAEDERTCPQCEELDGEVVALDGEFDDGITAPPAHPSCCPPGTLVLTRRGEIPIENVQTGDLVWTHRGRWRAVIGLMQRHVSEVLWSVRAGHRVLRITGNHPILTDNGWAVAAAIQPANQIYGVDAEAVLRSSREADDAPPLRDNRNFFGRILSALARRGMPASPVDLNSKMAIRDSDVNHKLANSIVQDSLDSARQESAVDDCLVERECATLTPSSFARETSFAHFAASDGVVGSFGESVAARSIRAAHSDVHGLAAIALLESESNEAGGDRGPSDLVPISERFERRPGHVLLMDFPAPLVGHPPSHTVIVPVDSATCLNYSGLVYNFEVEEDQTYVAQGIVVHNCRCTTVSAGYAQADQDEAA